jgi:hypothetical protein
VGPSDECPECAIVWVRVAGSGGDVAGDASYGRVGGGRAGWPPLGGVVERCLLGRAVVLLPTWRVATFAGCLLAASSTQCAVPAGGTRIPLGLPRLHSDARWVVGLHGCCAGFA